MKKFDQQAFEEAYSRLHEEREDLSCKVVQLEASYRYEQEKYTSLAMAVYDVLGPYSGTKIPHGMEQQDALEMALFKLFLHVNGKRPERGKTLQGPPASTGKIGRSRSAWAEEHGGLK